MLPSQRRAHTGVNAKVVDTVAAHCLGGEASLQLQTDESRAVLDFYSLQSIFIRRLPAVPPVVRSPPTPNPWSSNGIQPRRLGFALGDCPAQRSGARNCAWYYRPAIVAASAMPAACSGFRVWPYADHFLLEPLDGRDGTLRIGRKDGKVSAGGTLPASFYCAKWHVFLCRGA